MMADPRGPLRTILEVLPDRKGTIGTGDCTPLLLSCGHTAECNQVFTYKVCAETRCYQCRLEDLSYWSAV